ncbi:hypothetical protein ACRRTK_017370 [Alexandromys fortis]
MAASGVHRKVAAARRPEAGGRGGGGLRRAGLPARAASGRTGPRPRLLVRLEACWRAPGAGPAAPFLPGPTCWEEPGRGPRRASLRAPGFASPLSVGLKLVLAWTWDPAWPGRREAERFGHCETESGLPVEPAVEHFLPTSVSQMLG